MKQSFVCTIDEIKLKNKISITLNSINILLIYLDDELYAIENKCGHFGIPLDNGEVFDKSIKCAQHGIIFSLESGEHINRKWEDCEIIKRFNVKVLNNNIFVEV